MENTVKQLQQAKAEIAAQIAERDENAKKDLRLSPTTPAGINFSIPTLRLKAATIFIDDALTSLAFFSKSM